MNESTKDNDPSSLAVQMEHVYFSRGLSHVLKDITITIPHGQWVTIAGGNGSGKSTLVCLLNGLLMMTRGRILIDGIQLCGSTLKEIRKRIGIVFANPDDQFIGMTVEDDIAFGLENLGLSRDEMERRIRYYAELLNLGQLLQRHPDALSGGQKQRAAIAAVLAMAPSIVVFDEATSMLDERARNELLHFMKQMRESGRYTIVSVTHDAEEMAESDRVILLHGGSIVADGNPRAVLSQEDLLATCCLRMPFPLQLCRELRRCGIDIGEHVKEKEAMEAIWSYHLKKSLTATGTEG